MQNLSGCDPLAQTEDPPVTDAYFAYGYTPIVKQVISFPN